MNVKQLIGELQKLDPEKRVVVRGYEDGVDDVNTITEVHLKLDVNDAWYFGRHNVDDTGDCPAIYLGYSEEDES